MFSLLSYSSASVYFPDSAVCAVCHAGIRALLFFRADAEICLTRLKACVFCRVKRMLFAGFSACGGPRKRHSSSSPQCDSPGEQKNIPIQAADRDACPDRDMPTAPETGQSDSYSIPINFSESKKSFNEISSPLHSLLMVNRPGFFVEQSMICINVVSGTLDLYASA
jgi:hypothetical protein